MPAQMRDQPLAREVTPKALPRAPQAPSPCGRQPLWSLCHCPWPRPGGSPRGGHAAVQRGGPGSFLTTPPTASFHRVSRTEVSPRLGAVVRQLDGILEAGAVPETPRPGPSALCCSSPSLCLSPLLPVPSPGVPEFWERKPELRPQADGRPWAPAGRKR